MGLTSYQSKFAWMNKSFLGSLRRLLEDSEEIGGVLKESVSWNTKGDAFILRDKAVFATYLAPTYCSIMSVSTFRMVAQSWGFSLHVDPITGGETYQHPRFVRNDPSKCQGATMREMKESSTQPCHLESNDSKSPEVKPKHEDPLLLLAVTASASANRESSSKSTTSKTIAKKQIVSTKPKVSKPRRSSLSGILSTGRKTSLGLRMPFGNPLFRSVEQNLIASDATSATLELLKSSRRKSELVVSPLLGMPSRIVVGQQQQQQQQQHDRLTTITAATKIGNPSLGQLKKRVRLLRAQASLAARLQLLVEEPVVSTRTGTTAPNRPFLENLHAILEKAEQDRFTHIASWMNHGRSFRIYHEYEFSQVVYPRLTNGSPLFNVETTLKKYGFIKLSKGREKGAYFHPLFVRDLPMLGRGKTVLQWKAAGWKGDSTPEFFL